MSSDPATALEARRAPRDAIRLLVAVGCAHALLFLIAYGLLVSTPGVRAPDEEIIAFYQSGKQRRLVLVGLYVMPFAGIAFLWFTVALRAYFGATTLRLGELLSNLQLASGLLYVALFFASAASFSVMAVSVQFSNTPVDPVVARQLPQYGATLMLGFAMRMAAMFVFVSSRLGRASGRLPTWFAHIGLVVGLFLLLSASFSRVLVLVFPLWLLALCAILLLRSRRTPPAGVAGSS